MTLVSAIPEHKKMLVIFRMEPGSLGPDGSTYIKEFCEFAQIHLQTCGSAFISWSIVPRSDKSLAEIEFQILSKKLSRDKAGQYLNLFGEGIDSFEERLENNLEAIINQFFGR